MADTQVRVYRTAEEQAADEADAKAHGWVVLERGWTSDGRIQVVYGDRLAARSRRIRLSSIAIAVWCGLMLLLAIAMVNAQAHCDTMTYEDACQAGETLGRGIGVAAIGFVWLIGFLGLSLVWFATRPKR
ncbi:MAG: hypothetical protein U0667_05740 [Chloroflexota bacterium]